MLTLHRAAPSDTVVPASAMDHWLSEKNRQNERALRAIAMLLPAVRKAGSLASGVDHVDPVVAVVDDEAVIAITLAELLNRHGFRAGMASFLQVTQEGQAVLRDGRKQFADHVQRLKNLVAWRANDRLHDDILVNPRGNTIGARGWRDAGKDLVQCVDQQETAFVQCFIRRVWRTYRSRSAEVVWR